MGSLVDSFLDDLEDLERDDVQAPSDARQTAVADNSKQDAESAESENAAKEYSTLLKDPSLHELVEKVRVLAQNTNVNQNELGLMEQCNKVVLEIDREIINIYNYVKDIYSKRFPKLESIVYSPLDYIAVVKRAQNESDFASVDLSDLLPNTMIMAITVAATMTSGTELTPQQLSQALGACDEAMTLADFRNDILVYLASRMNLLAPNVSAILTTPLTARLITHAGGLENLAKMPSQNIALIGSSRKGTNVPGIIYTCELIQNATPATKQRAVRLVAGRVSLAAKIDLFREYTSGEKGEEYRKFIVASLQKAQEPPPAPTKKSLPIPDEKRATKRGGKRYRKSKERLAISEFRKHANRLAFGEPEDQVGLEFDDGLGMLGKGTGHGRLLLTRKHNKITLPKRRAVAMQSSGATGGISSSLAFTPLQGIELCNPSANVTTTKRQNSILDNTGGFFKVSKQSK